MHTIPADDDAAFTRLVLDNIIDTGLPDQKWTVVADFGRNGERWDDPSKYPPPEFERRAAYQALHYLGMSLDAIPCVVKIHGASINKMKRTPKYIDFRDYRLLMLGMAVGYDDPTADYRDRKRALAVRAWIWRVGCVRSPLLLEKKAPAGAPAAIAMFNLEQARDASQVAQFFETAMYLLKADYATIGRRRRSYADPDFEEQLIRVYCELKRKGAGKHPSLDEVATHLRPHTAEQPGMPRSTFMGRLRKLREEGFVYPPECPTF